MSFHNQQPQDIWGGGGGQQQSSAASTNSGGPTQGGGANNAGSPMMMMMMNNMNNNGPGGFNQQQQMTMTPQQLQQLQQLQAAGSIMGAVGAQPLGFVSLTHSPDASTDIKVLQTMVASLAEKLPINSGLPISFLETDASFNATLRAIAEVSPWRMWDVVADLSNVIDEISTPQRVSKSKGLDANGNPTIELLHSQLLMMRILANCVGYYWKLYRDARNPNNFEHLAKDFHVPSFNAVPDDGLPVHPSNIRHIPDPPPLEEGLGRFVISAVFNVFFCHTGQVNLDWLDHIHFPQGITPSARGMGVAGVGMTEEGLVYYDPERPPQGTVPTISLMGMNNMSHQVVHFFMRQDLKAYFPSSDLYAVPNSIVGVQQELLRIAGRVMFFISSTNWPLMVTRVKKRLEFVQSASNNGDVDELGALDLSDLRAMEWMNLNRYRLTNIIHDYVTTYKLVPRKMQYFHAISIRRIIQSWIETHPMEFVQLYQSGRRIEGNPDQLFMILSSFLEGMTGLNKRRMVFWPAQTMLLIACPDILQSVWIAHMTGKSPLQPASGMPVATGMLAKGVALIEGLRKGLKGKGYETAALCLVDIYRAATFLGRNDGGVLRQMAIEMEAELREKLFPPLLARASMTTVWSGGGPPGTVEREDVFVEPRLLIDCMTAFLKLNPAGTLKLIRQLIESKPPGSGVMSAFNVILVKSCLEIVSEPYTFTWLTPLDASLAVPLRSLFMSIMQETMRERSEGKIKKVQQPPQFQTVVAEKKNRDKKLMLMPSIESVYNERNDVIVGILKIWCRSPIMAIASNTTVIKVDSIRMLFKNILACLLEPSSTIRKTAARTLTVLLDLSFVSVWDGSIVDWRTPRDKIPTESTMLAFWRTTSSIVNMLCQQLLDLRHDGYPPESRRPGVPSNNGLGNNAENHGPCIVSYGIMVSLLNSNLDVLKDVLTFRNSFLKKHPGLASIGSGLPERLEATSLLESTLLVILCSPDPEVISKVITCIGLLVDEISLADGSSLGGPHEEMINPGSTSDMVPSVVSRNSVIAPSEQGALRRAKSDIWGDSATGSPLSLVANIQVFRELKTLYSGGGVIAGQKAIQKKIRKVLRKTAYATTGTLGAWEEVYRRWRLLCGPLLMSNTGRAMGSTSEDDKGDRQNFTGFLCAMGAMSFNINLVNTGVPRLAAATARIQVDVNQDPITAAVVARAKESAEKFVIELVTLMTCDNVAIREYIKDFLGNELNSALFDILFVQCETIVTRYLAPEMSSSQGDDRITFFVESFISVLKMILERSEEDVVTEQEFLSMSGTVDFGSLILTFIQYLNRLRAGPQARTNQKTISTILYIRIKMCQLVEVVVKKKEIIGLRQEIRFRNRMLDVLMEWSAELIPGSGYFNDETFVSNERAIRDLDLSIMKTLVLILGNLPLQPSSETNQTPRINRGSEGDDGQDIIDTTNELKGKLFYKYLTFFMQVLQRVKNMETTAIKKLEMSTVAIEAPGVVVRTRDALQNNLRPLKEYAILALSNLLQANIEVGLKYSLAMGYNEDAKIRTSFMQVLTNLLESGAKEQFESLGEEGQMLQRRYDKLVDLVVDQDLSIALSLRDVSDVDEVAGILMSIFSSKGQSVRLLTAVIEHEVARTVYPSNLFRHNSMATRLFTLFTRSCGSDYLVAALRPVFDEILAIKPTLTFEIDPVRRTEYDDVTINLKNLKQLVKRLLDNIVGAQNFLPPELRTVCHHLSNIVGKRFPEARATSVGAFMFLRFICPVIVAPEILPAFGPIDNKDIKRGLVLATKVIQNLANNVLFGSKETFMVDLNDLLKKNIARVHGFLRFVSDADMSNQIKQTEQPISEYDLMRLHRILALNLDKVENAILSGSMGRPTESRNATMTALSTLIAQLGPAPDANRLRLALISKERKGGNRNSAPLLTTQMYQDFIVRIAARPGIDKALEVMKETNVCYTHGVSKEGRPVIYFIARRFNPDAIDMDLAMYYILSVAAAMPTTGFDVVLDATTFSAENEWDLHYLRRFEEILPLSISNNLGRIYLLNCNSAFRKFLNNVSKSISLEHLNRHVTFVSSLDDLFSFIHPQQVNVPKSTFHDKEVISVFSPVSKILNGREHVPVMLKVCSDSVHVTVVQKMPVLNTETVLTDSYRFADIQDVIVGADQNEFFIKCAEKVKGVYAMSSSASIILSTLIFSSPKRDAILSDIRDARAKYQMSRPSNIIADERNLRPGDVPGTLLNMAMLNLGSGDPVLRQTSYNLLVALASNFDFKHKNQLLGANGLCIPGNNLGFIVSVSSHLAITEKNLTLEFLIECVLSFSKSTKDQKIFCLEYMAPWIPNLVHSANPSLPQNHHIFLDTVETDEEHGSEASYQKLQSLIKLLLERTVSEIELFHIIQTKVWTEIGKCELLLPIVLDILIENAVEQGIGSECVEVVGNTLVTLAMIDMDQVSGKVLFRLIRLLETDSDSIVNDQVWPEITVLLRLLLMISFNNLLDVKTFLPEVFYIIMLTIGLGRPLVRSAVYGICINVMHSICTLASMDDDTKVTVQKVLSNLASPETSKLFGVISSEFGHQERGSWLPTATPSALIISGESLTGESAATTPIRNIRAILVEMDKMMCIGGGDKELAYQWTSRWMSLILEKCFDLNSSVQPRCFIALGVLHKANPSPVILVELLYTLHTFLRILDDTNNVRASLVSLLRCITDVIHGLEYVVELTEILKAMFWIGVGLLQFGDTKIFSASVGLLEVIIKTLDKFGEFKEAGFGNTLLVSRASSEIDKVSALWFNADFSFAMSGLLLKGMHNLASQHLKSATLNLLKTLLVISQRNPPPDHVPQDYVADHSLGYVLALLPFCCDNVRLLLAKAGVPTHLLADELQGPEEGYYRLILNVLPPFVDQNRSLLMVIMLVVALDVTNAEKEMCLIYGILGEVTLEFPETIMSIYETLLPKINQVLISSQSQALTSMVQSIFMAMLATAPMQQPSVPAFIVTPRRNSMGSINSGTSGSRRSQSGSVPSLTAFQSTAMVPKPMMPFPLYADHDLFIRLSELGLAGLTFQSMFGKPISAAVVSPIGDLMVSMLESRNIIVDIVANDLVLLLKTDLVRVLEEEVYSVRDFIPVWSDEELEQFRSLV